MKEKRYSFVVQLHSFVVQLLLLKTNSIHKMHVKHILKILYIIYKYTNTNRP